MHLNGRITRALAALLAMLVLTGGMLSAQAETFEWLFGGSGGSEKVKDSALEDDGMLRVYLKSLNDPQQLHITLAGSYAVEGDAGFYFDRDARLTLSASEGSVYMAVGGLTINMGRSLTLTRHRAEDGAENGIRIDESEKDALFCGDLRISADGNSLKPVLTLHIEDYLYGVVAYEMSDSFPIEALKAQAVAARTYALQRKWSAGKKDYDVVDTTADQVYKGYIGDYVNVIEAVDATRGVVGVYDGGFATCYYTASNGGQTALASQIWGGTGSDGYLAMTADPYDLENPSSLSNAITVSDQCEGSAKLRAMLMDALAERMRADGWQDGQWTFEAIEAIEPANPRFEGSLMCDHLAFTVRVSTRRSVAASPAPDASPIPEASAAADMASPLPSASAAPAASPASDIQAAFAAFSAPRVSDVPAASQAAPLPDPAQLTVMQESLTVTVHLDVYDQIKDGLSLGLNGSDYELISAETAEDAGSGGKSFTIIMRRFGHGVGMSQRGAQQMAGAYDKSWLDILSFYYPGMSVERIRWPEEALTAIGELPDNVGAARPAPTPTPTPAPLPPLKEGEYYAQVALETRSSSLNVRQQPGTAFRVVDQLSHGQRVIVSSAPDAEGWVSIHTAECTGYVKLEYLRAE